MKKLGNLTAHDIASARKEISAEIHRREKAYPELISNRRISKSVANKRWRALQVALTIVRHYEYQLEEPSMFPDADANAIEPHSIKR